MDVYTELLALGNSIESRRGLGSRTVVAVSGLEGSGKSTFCGRYVNYLKGQGVHGIHIRQDSYFVDNRPLWESFRGATYEEWYEHHASPRPIHHSLLRANIMDLSKGGEMHEYGLYERCSGLHTLRVDADAAPENTWILVDGIWTLHDTVRSLADLVLIVHADFDVRRARLHEREQRKDAYVATEEELDVREEGRRAYLAEHYRPGDFILMKNDWELMRLAEGNGNPPWEYDWSRAELVSRQLAPSDTFKNPLGFAEGHGHGNN